MGGVCNASAEKNIDPLEEKLFQSIPGLPEGSQELLQNQKTRQLVYLKPFGNEPPKFKDFQLKKAPSNFLKLYKTKEHVLGEYSAVALRLRWLIEQFQRQGVALEVVCLPILCEIWLFLEDCEKKGAVLLNLTKDNFGYDKEGRLLLVDLKANNIAGPSKKKGVSEVCETLVNEVFGRKEPQIENLLNGKLESLKKIVCQNYELEMKELAKALGSPSLTAAEKLNLLLYVGKRNSACSFELILSKCYLFAEGNLLEIDSSQAAQRLPAPVLADQAKAGPWEKFLGSVIRKFKAQGRVHYDSELNHPDQRITDEFSWVHSNVGILEQGAYCGKRNADHLLELKDIRLDLYQENLLVTAVSLFEFGLDSSLLLSKEKINELLHNPLLSLGPRMRFEILYSQCFLLKKLKQNPGVYLERMKAVFDSKYPREIAILECTVLLNNEPDSTKLSEKLKELIEKHDSQKGLFNRMVSLHLLRLFFHTGNISKFMDYAGKLLEKYRENEGYGYLQVIYLLSRAHLMEGRRDKALKVVKEVTKLKNGKSLGLPLEAFEKTFVKILLLQKKIEFSTISPEALDEFKFLSNKVGWRANIYLRTLYLAARKFLNKGKLNSAEDLIDIIKKFADKRKRNFAWKQKMALQANLKRKRKECSSVLKKFYKLIESESERKFEMKFEEAILFYDCFKWILWIKENAKKEPTRWQLDGAKLSELETRFFEKTSQLFSVVSISKPHMTRIKIEKLRIELQLVSDRKEVFNVLSELEVLKYESDQSNSNLNSFNDLLLKYLLRSAYIKLGELEKALKIELSPLAEEQAGTRHEMDRYNSAFELQEMFIEFFESVRKNVFNEVQLTNKLGKLLKKFSDVKKEVSLRFLVNYKDYQERLLEYVSSKEHLSQAAVADIFSDESLFDEDSFFETSVSLPISRQLSQSFL